MFMKNMAYQLTHSSEGQYSQDPQSPQFVQQVGEMTATTSSMRVQSDKPLLEMARRKKVVKQVLEIIWNKISTLFNALLRITKVPFIERIFETLLTTTTSEQRPPINF
jgi:hypothetical protein